MSSATAEEQKEQERKIDSEIYDQTVLGCTREFCRVEDPARVEVDYLQNLTNMHGMTVRQFSNRLRQINDYLPYFPPYELDKVVVQKLRESELISILIRTKPVSMSIAISRANVNLRKMTFDEIVN